MTLAYRFNAFALGAQLLLFSTGMQTSVSRAAPSPAIAASPVQPVHTVRTTHWFAEIAPRHGGQLLHLRHLPSGHEVFHYPETREQFLAQPERFGVPVLFPPNRIADGRFTWRGRDYVLPVNERAPRNNHLHGIVLHEPWQIEVSPPEEAAPDHARVILSFRHDNTRATFSGYPYTFLLTITYEFSPDEVGQTTCLRNLDTHDAKIPMPFGLGFHTAFRLPPPQQTRSHLRVTAADYHWELDPVRRLPTGARIPWPEGERYQIAAGQTIDPCRPLVYHCPAITELIDGKPFRGALLDFPEQNLRLTYEVGGDFKHWFLWTPPDDSRVLCIEPMTWMVNAPNQLLPPETTGMLSLNSGDTWETATRIRLLRHRFQ
ncbi:galactose mutarotase-like enzyme [Opitutaceae bacterium TAV1]|nr:galactose mutarotase-like enzyme [Opitutaceae bacterium TAV1]